MNNTLLHAAWLLLLCGEVLILLSASALLIRGALL